MQKNTHLLNLITQILDAREASDKPTEVRLLQLAVAEIEKNGIPKDLLGQRRHRAVQLLNQTLSMMSHT